MTGIDDELVARALRWCAEAGCPSTAADVVAALEPLGWDELLAARALLADPPPARPLGPRALAELARGASPAQAAAREIAGEQGHSAAPSHPPPKPEAPATRANALKRVRAAVAPRIRRASEHAAPASPQAPPQPLLDALFASEGRTVLERLLREHGARRPRLSAALAAGWRRSDGSPPDGGDLERLLDAHGFAHGFARREHDELLHALRAAGGVRRRAAEVVGFTPAELDLALERLGAREEAEAIRSAHRRDLRRRALLADRVRLLLTEEVRLSDLGLLEEFEADLRARLPDLLRALRTGKRGPLGPALGESLGLAPGQPQMLARRLGIDLDAPTLTSKPTSTSSPRSTATATATRTSTPNSTRTRNASATRNPTRASTRTPAGTRRPDARARPPRPSPGGKVPGAARPKRRGGSRPHR